MKLDDFMDQYSVKECETNYGAGMIESSLADWLELAALRGVGAPWSAVADAWKDTGLPPVGKSGMIAENSDSAEELEYYDLAREEIGWRGKYLGNLYPFEINQFGSLVVKFDFEVNDSVYIDLLIVSLLKGFAYKQNKSLLKPITDYFELLVNECLRAGLCDGNELFKTSVIGTSHNSGSFEGKLCSTARELGIIADPTAAPRSASAKDDGVDIICGLVWGDGRKTDMLWAVQAACGQSQEWQTKLYRVHMRKWAQYLSERVVPRALIAVPYSITNSVVMRVIDEADNRSFLDRGRLVRIASNRTDLQSESLYDLRSRVLELASSQLRINICSFA